MNAITPQNIKTAAREYAFQFLYHLQLDDFKDIREDLINNDDSQELHQEIQEFEGRIEVILKENAKKYAYTLIEGILSNWSNIQDLINEKSDKWKTNKLSKIDLTIIMLATYEIFHIEELNKKISINEALELAKKFSTKESKNVVNAILDKM